MADNSACYICTECGWIYDPQHGDPDGGIPPGTPWEEIPDDWTCPVCGVGKEDFEPIDAPHAPSAAAESESIRPDSDIRPFVIVGSGLAGYSVAKELRRHGNLQAIVIVTADGGEEYTKPMLSNALARKHRPDDLVHKDATSLAVELNVKIKVRSKVLSIGRHACHLELDTVNGTETLVYDRLVLAIGAEPRVFPVAGDDKVDVATVNDLDDYRRWRERIGDGGRILLIGAGLIGCEFADDLRSAGFQVSIVDPAPWPLARFLPEPIGIMLTEALEGAGCKLYPGRSLARYLCSESDLIAILDDGTEIPFDHVLSAVGLTPRTQLAAQAGLNVSNGILVDRHMRTSDPAIFALGDCAKTAAGPLPFVAPLLVQAKVIAATLSGNETDLYLPAMPVVVKTPSLPLVICPPPLGEAGGWQVEIEERSAVAIFHADDGREIGFVLAGRKTALQHELTKKMPALLLADRVATPSRTSASQNAE